MHRPVGPQSLLGWSFWTGAPFCCLTSGMVLVAAMLGLSVFRFPVPGAAAEDAVARLAAGDGLWYASIAHRGYERDGAAFQDVVFFPAFPLVSRWLASTVSLRTEVALLVVANLCLLGAFVCGAAFMRYRYPDEPPEVTDYALLALGLRPRHSSSAWPTLKRCSFF